LDIYITILFETICPATNGVKVYESLVAVIFAPGWNERLPAQSTGGLYKTCDPQVPSRVFPDMTRIFDFI
jgi:hypothetical protein